MKRRGSPVRRYDVSARSFHRGGGNVQMRLYKVLTVAVAMGICGVADAKKATTQPAGVHGVIESVQASANQITVKIGNARKGNLQSLRIVLGPNVSIELKNN